MQAGASSFLSCCLGAPRVDKAEGGSPLGALDAQILGVHLPRSHPLSNGPYGDKFCINPTEFGTTKEYFLFRLN